MKEHPILFSTPMVQAILEGRKTQTRRVVKPQPEGDSRPISEWNPHVYGSIRAEYETKIVGKIFPFKKGNSLYSPSCPYGQAGDILWVRETWAYLDFLGPEDADYVYKASDNGKDWENNTEGWKWKPSIYMPKEACRLFLKIKSVRVERLQDISEEDAKAEGVLYYGEESNDYKNYEYNDIYGDDWGVLTAKESFKTLWQSINGPESWLANPWVWVIEFELSNTPK